MFATQIKVQPLPAGKDINTSDRGKQETGQRSWSGPLAWYLAQPALHQCRCILTVSGYVVLP